MIKAEILNLFLLCTNCLYYGYFTNPTSKHYARSEATQTFVVHSLLCVPRQRRYNHIKTQISLTHVIFAIGRNLAPKANLSNFSYFFN